jgi:hypothetical protein
MNLFINDYALLILANAGRCDALGTAYNVGDPIEVRLRFIDQRDGERHKDAPYVTIKGCES